MSKSTKIHLKRQIRNFKHTFLQTGQSSAFELLPTDFIQKISATASRRNKVFTPLVTLKAFLLQVLSDDASCKEAVAKVLAERLDHELPPNSVNTGPYCKARQRLNLTQLVEAVRSVGKRLTRHTESWHWKGFHVVMVDGSTALMPDTPDNQHRFPQQSNQKPGLGFPIVRMVALISLTVGAVIDYSIGPYQGKGSGETSLFSQLIGTLSQGQLLLADRYYCTYAIVALLLEAGIPVLFSNHAQKKPDFRRGKKLGDKDHLIDWHKPKRIPVWMSKAAYDQLPEVIQVREFAKDGTVYATTLIEDRLYGKKELAALYQQRWQIELDMRSIKTHMGMEKLRCQSAAMVKKEIAVHLLAYNLIRGCMAQAATLHDKTPRELSFRATVQLIHHGTVQLSHVAGARLNIRVESLLKAIASTPTGKRKRKNQPRAIKRRPKAYPLLTKPRHEYA